MKKVVMLDEVEGNERDSFFTKSRKKDYNNFKVKPLISKLLIKFTDFSRFNSCNRYIYEREGLYMKETKVVLNELKNGLNWRNKILVNIFPKTCMKLYRKGMNDCFNYFNK